MRILFIGGTGTISRSVSLLAVERGIDLFLLNRGRSGVEIPGAKVVTGDIGRPDEVAKALRLGEKGLAFDAVVDWIAYVPEHVERDIALFAGKTKQYVFISSASAYQKPPTHHVITESTPLVNPFWEYSRNKIACEDRLMREHRRSGFPVTVVRPSHTYDRNFPASFGSRGYTIPDRIKRGGKIAVHGDGTSLWTLTHAEDFAKAFVGLLGNVHAVGHAFHITSDEVLTWNRIIGVIGDAVGAEPEIVHVPSDLIARFSPEVGAGLLGDKANCALFDNSKVKRFVPGYVATISFAEGMRRAAAWFDADESRKVVDEGQNRLMDRIIAAYENGLADASPPS